MAAHLILDSFRNHLADFGRITERAKRHFEAADWAAAREDSVRRLNLYGVQVRELVEAVRRDLGESAEHRSTWSGLRAEYSSLAEGDPNRELAETWFNSVTRKVFETVGVDDGIEFVDTAASTNQPPDLLLARYEPAGDVARCVESVVRAAEFATPFEDLAGQCAEVADRLVAAMGGATVESLEMIPAPFFREQAAYLIGRAVGSGGVPRPFVLAIRNPAGRLEIDAVLLDVNAVSILFSFTRAYFHVQADQPAAVIGFLETLMPRKRVAELYNSLGFHKHGKTELYRELLAHMRTTDRRFQVSKGAVGLVMIVFDMDDFDIVFKVIRDRFPPPKTTTRNAIKQQYRLVFEHDRAGRLVEAHEFEHLSVNEHRFDPDLRSILGAQASRTVHANGGRLVIDHAYLERKVTPLNLFVREVAEAEAREAILSYGSCIKDLMASDIFPGDMLLKNFGVTRHGRVVFYDYDELSRITECRFRAIPVSDDPYDEMAEDPWFGVREGDIFPEEFPRFMGLPEPLMALFREHHGDLFDHRTWENVRQRLEAGERIEIIPYGPELRLRSAEKGRARP